MQRNIYRPPAAELQDVNPAGSDFYVVSAGKFLALYLATLGLYGIYWFYRHWRAIRLSHRPGIWPLPRALFAIVFAFPLFRHIFDRARARGLESGLPATACALVYAVFEIGGNSTELLARFDLDDFVITLVSFGCMLVVAVTLLYVQRHANHACGDTRGSGNRRFTGWNLLWILLGMVSWAMLVVGLLLIYELLEPWRFGIYPGSAGG